MFTAKVADVGDFIRDSVQPAPIAEPAIAPVQKVAVQKTPRRHVATKAAPILAKAPAVEVPAVGVSAGDAQLAMPTSLLTMQPMIKISMPTKAVMTVKNVQNFYNSTKSFTATFTQEVTNITFSKLKPKKSEGKVYILKPGKMRWDYKNKSHRTAKDPKVSKSFISDGKYLWAVMHKNKQFYKEELNGSALPVAVSFLMGKGDLLSEFDASLETSGKFGSKSDILLLLTPKVPSARYKKLWLVVDPKTYAVKQSVVLNSKGDTNSIVFSNEVLNSGKLKAGHFIFNSAANKSYKLVTPPKP